MNESALGAFSLDEIFRFACGRAKDPNFRGIRPSERIDRVCLIVAVDADRIVCSRASKAIARFTIRNVGKGACIDENLLFPYGDRQAEGVGMAMSSRPAPKRPSVEHDFAQTVLKYTQPRIREDRCPSGPCRNPAQRRFGPPAGLGIASPLAPLASVSAADQRIESGESGATELIASAVRMKPATPVIISQKRQAAVMAEQSIQVVRHFLKFLPKLVAGFCQDAAWNRNISVA